MDHLGPLAVSDEAENAAQTRHADLPVCRDQDVAGLHAPNKIQTGSKLIQHIRNFFTSLIRCDRSKLFKLKEAES